MIIEFSVGNFRSFKDIAVISMVAANINSRNRDLDANNVFTVGNLSLLKSAGIYGANASGKSNLVLALRFMRHLILNSSRNTQVNEEIDVENFRLSSETEHDPSHFELVFLMKGIKYRYGFKVTSKRVMAEWLYYVPSRVEAMLFERDGEKIKLGSRFKEGKRLEEKTRDNSLFLSVVAQFNGEISQALLKWFGTLDVSIGLSDTSDLLRGILKFDDPKYQRDIIEFVKRFDVGVEDILLEKGDTTAPKVPVDAPDEVKQIIEIMRKMEGEQRTIRTVHRMYGNKEKESTQVFDLDKHESEGTRKLFALAFPILQSLRHGRTVVIDELDARLHPLITREIIKLFNSKDTNPRNAQLVFTTHDTNLLSNELLRRDQIWFAEKSKDGSTHLYSLVEYKQSASNSKVRNDAALEKNYIQGRYGAIPFIGDFRPLIGEGDA